DSNFRAAERAIAASAGHGIVIADTIARARAQAAPPSAAPLAGVTLVVKDNIDVAGTVTSLGARLSGALTAVRSAPAVAALEAAGARVVAKVNLHQFAYGASSENPAWGDVRNPRFPEHTPGGSSGGTAAALAAGIGRIGLGTDTSGSIRMPAACCGVVGLRPRNGIVSAGGVAPLCPSFDAVGPMARTVADTALAWQALLAGAGLSAHPGSVAEGGTHF
ncbi:amidase, partial [Leucobacter sp. M11]|uniref:amidase n=1 Tax=Leucobacter sp. M11 TaxID=2993565 RepID=UPI002D7E8BAB